MARLFFSLWPDMPARTSLAARAQDAAKLFGGRPVSEGNLHLTLVFLGEVESSRIVALRQAADKAEGTAFALSLDLVGGFRRAGVVWAGCRRPPAELLRFQANLECLVREAGFAVDDRPFAPHLTLVRHAKGPREPGEIEQVSWCAKAFALVESVPGRGAYRTLAEWPLGREET
jgi:2'-5' RNA ligase